jgi:translation initiation factor 2B subunit (eIF-2B alpha/beta/delta family)
MDHLRHRIDAMANDRQSGATALLAAGLDVLRDALATGQPILPVARALCQAQPNMAALWNAAAAAVAARTEPERLDHFGARVAHAPAALARHAREHFLATGTTPLRAVTVSASAAVRTVLTAVALDRPVRAACGEARPGLEGRTQAAALAAAGVPAAVFSDAGLGHALAGADLVIVGADAVAPEWFVNKSGTAMLAAMAVRLGVPVYVAATRDRFAGHALAARLPLDEGPAAEVWDQPPAGVTPRNPLFERVPLDLVTAVLSDTGLLGVDMVPDACAAAQDDALIEALRVLADED